MISGTSCGAHDGQASFSWCSTSTGTRTVCSASVGTPWCLNAVTLEVSTTPARRSGPSAIAAAAADTVPRRCG